MLETTPNRDGNRETLSLRMHKDLISQLKTEAELEDRTISALANILIRDGLAARKQEKTNS